MSIYLHARSTVAASLLLGASCAGAQIVSTFDAGLEGWTGAGGALSFVAGSGNPGGFLRQVDNLGTFMTVSAPVKFLGDLSSYLEGTIAFDARNLSGSASDLPPPGPWFGTVTIQGTAGSAVGRLAGTTAGNPPPDGQWHSYSALLTAPAWTGNLGAVLSNVTGIAVQLEFNNAIVESAGFDNFSISAVPEVPTAALLAAGLVALGMARRRQGYLVPKMRSPASPSPGTM